MSDSPLNFSYFAIPKHTSHTEMKITSSKELKTESLSTLEISMNLDKLSDFAITIFLAAALAGNLDSFTN